MGTSTEVSSQNTVNFMMELFSSLDTTKSILVNADAKQNKHEITRATIPTLRALGLITRTSGRNYIKHPDMVNCTRELCVKLDHIFRTKKIIAHYSPELRDEVVETLKPLGINLPLSNEMPLEIKIPRKRKKVAVSQESEFHGADIQQLVSKSELPTGNSITDEDLVFAIEQRTQAANAPVSLSSFSNQDILNEMTKRFGTLIVVLEEKDKELASKTSQLDEANHVISNMKDLIKKTF